MRACPCLAGRPGAAGIVAPGVIGMTTGRAGVAGAGAVVSLGWALARLQAQSTPARPTAESRIFSVTYPPLDVCNRYSRTIIVPAPRSVKSSISSTC